MRKNNIRFISIFLAFILIISASGCKKPEQEYRSVGEIITTEHETETETATEQKIQPSLTMATVSETPETTNRNMTVTGLCYDVTARKYLYLNGINKKICPASLTKLVTALTALKYVPPDTVFTVGDELKLVKPNSSLCLIKKGHKLSLYDLICGMLIASGNDAAYTVAVNTARYVMNDIDISDSEAVAYFCGLMNDYTKSIGASNSFFVNPDGWDDERQYTTADDLLKIALQAQKSEVISVIASTGTKRVVFASGQNITWKNTNLLLDKSSKYYYPDATGLKTGTTGGAGKCLVASAEKNGRKIIAIALNCNSDEERYSFAIDMFNSAFE